MRELLTGMIFIKSNILFFKFNWCLLIITMSSYIVIYIYDIYDFLIFVSRL